MNRYLKFLTLEVKPYFTSRDKKPLHQQLREAGEVWRRYRCVPYHYFKHRLYETSVAGDYRDYIPPVLIKNFQVKVNPADQLHIIANKYETNRRLQERGLPCAATLIMVGPDGTLTDALGQRVASPEEAISRLARAPTELFVKPIDGGVGEGAFVARKAEVDADFLRRHRNILIQPRLVNHPALDRLFSGSLNTVRVDTLLTPDGVLVNGAALKVGTGNAQVDNWAKGAIAIGVDLQTGELHPSGVTKASFGRVIYRAHPDTGVPFAGFVIPFWAEALAMVREAAKAVHPHVSLGWDIAITPDGPVIVEANETGDFFLLQEAVGPMAGTPLARESCKAWGLPPDGRA